MSKQAHKWQGCYLNNFSNLPTSWQIKTLGEVCEKISAGGDKPNDCTAEKTQENQIPIFSNGVENNGLYGYTKTPTITKPALTISARGTIGFVCVRYEPFFPIVRLISAIPNDKILVLEFLAYALRYLIPQGEGSSIPQLTIPNFKQIKIPLPPLEIQKRIVARLESAFEKIEKGSAHLQDAKTKLAKYKQSLLKSAFDGTLTATASLRGVEKAETIHKVDCHESANANFHNDDKSVDCHDLTSSKLAMTDKENPKLPQGWTIKTLGEIYDITSSKRVFKDEWKTDGIPFYRARDLVSFLKNEPIKNPLFISETMYNEYSNKYGIPLEDDILVTGVGTIEIPYLVKANEKFYFKDGNILWFKKRASNIFSKYVYYLFLSNLLDTNSKGSTVLTYTIINAKNTKIPLPPLETQKQIVKLLEKHLQHADKTGEFIESALNKAKQLKQSLLKSAFLGKLT